MNISEILAHCDHTLLTPSATWAEVKQICEEGMRYRTASVCIPPCYVRQAKEFGGPKLNVCTVIGFPNGYNTSEIKAKECEAALSEGADEIDMVIRIGAVKSGDYDSVLHEIETLKALCGKRVLKVIIEACLLTEAEKVTMCELVSAAKADYIKTSTGFSKWGAKAEDILLFKQHLGPAVKMKAAGGISSLAEAEQFLSLGCDRIGSSRLVKLAQEVE